jgi:hypothetical protein
MIFRGDPCARRTTILFYALAFAFAWACWFVEPAVRTADPLAARLLVMRGASAPRWRQ